MSQDLDKENLDNDIELSKTVSFKPHKKEERSKTAKEATKFPGWKEGKDFDKYSYSDRFVQKLVKHSKQKTLIKRQPKVQFKPSEALLAEAAKVDELLNKLIVRSEETERSTKIASSHNDSQDYLEVHCRC